MTAVFLFPLLWVIGLSLKTRLQVFAVPPLFVWWPTFENYASVLGPGGLFAGLRQQPGGVVGAVLLSLCVGVPAAYAFARFPFRADRSVLLAAGHAHAAADRGSGADVRAVQQIWPDHDTVQRRAGLQTFSLPLVVWIMRGFFEDLPRELEESAWVDGASATPHSATSCCR